jgi:hypothetical protein
MFNNTLDSISTSLTYQTEIKQFERRHSSEQPWLESIPALESGPTVRNLSEPGI